MYRSSKLTDLIPIPIHNSDIQSFKGCRERWNWLSDLREGLKPIETPVPLSFGSAIHAAAEVYYRPETWPMVVAGGQKREALIANAIQAFLLHIAGTRKRYLKFTGREALDELQQGEYDEQRDLGIGMLLHYFEYIYPHDMASGLTPVGVEVPFEFQVFDTIEEQNDLLPHLVGHRVVFRGRIDLLASDKDGLLWIVDHKTTARMPDKLQFLEMDEQMGSYILGHSIAIAPIAGAIYNEIYKAYPQPPELLKVQRLGRNYSVSKSQATSYDLYLKTITDAGEDVSLYEDFLHWLKNFGTTYVRRTPIPRTNYELANLAERIKLVTLDMLDAPRIYPNPGRWSCDYCPAAQACLAKMDGSDYQWILDTQFIKEQRTNA
jgi:hypothetical protein